jgi:myo-inositol-1(or 4)-monophosphatase
VDDLDVAMLAAREAAAVVEGLFGTGMGAEMKGAVDPVTAADRAAEAAILAVLRRHRPADDILAEESGAAGEGGGRRWIVDPLDGTVNFLHGIPHVAVSVALWDGGRPRVGVIADVMRADLYTATAGGGAARNGAPIATSPRRALPDLLVATGFPYDRDRMGHVYAEWVGGVLPRVRGVRRMGSAALDFAYVAAGHFDGYFEHGLAPWDAAAGILLVAEAGGHTVDLNGSPVGPGATDFISTSGAAHEVLARLIREAAPALLREGR